MGEISKFPSLTTSFILVIFAIILLQVHAKKPFFTEVSLQNPQSHNVLFKTNHLVSNGRQGRDVEYEDESESDESSEEDTSWKYNDYYDDGPPDPNWVPNHIRIRKQKEAEAAHNIKYSDWRLRFGSQKLK